MEVVKNVKKNRLHLVDEYRGFWLVNMIFYHAIWDLVYIFDCNWKWFASDIAFYWQQSICWSFIFVSGFCWQMSRQNLKRGLQVFGAGLIITIATLVFMPGSRVIFGVLTLIGSSMLLMLPLDKLFKAFEQKISCFALLGAILSFILFLFVYPINDGYLGFLGERMIYLPRELYSSILSTYLGFTEPGFWSTDYFSIFPWFFLYMTGYFIYSFFMRDKHENTLEISNKRTEAAKNLLSKSLCPPLGWAGRNALIIYMLHQPVVYGILMVWNYLR